MIIHRKFEELFNILKVLIIIGQQFSFSHNVLIHYIIIKLHLSKIVIDIHLLLL